MSVRANTSRPPAGLDPRSLRRRALLVGGGIAVLVLVAVLAPGLGEVRDHLADARPGWVALAVVFEALSVASYVLMFRPVFCAQLGRRRSVELGLAEVGVGSIVPASGIGGLALGAWVLHERGVHAEQIARRSVAFFLIKSSVNFVAVAVVGVVMAVGVGPHFSLALTLGPAVLAVAVLAAVLALPRVKRGGGAREGAGRVRRTLVSSRRALVEGAGEARVIVGRRQPGVLLGALGYWVWDNAVLWATFHAFGAAPALTVVLMGYLIGQLGGLLPLPGGLGGIDGGLIGALVVYGAPAAVTTAAVLVYRVILFWLPLLVGTPAFAALRRDMASSTARQ